MSTTQPPIVPISLLKRWSITQNSMLPTRILSSATLEVISFAILEYSTEMMHYAHDSLLNSFSANKDDFVALPTGSGSTGAIEKAIKMIKSLEKEYAKPAIYITPYEHHSNILPWV